MTAAEELLAQIASLEIREHEQHEAWKATRVELAVLRERLARVDRTAPGLQPLERVVDPLTAAASLAVEDLPATFTPRELADKLSVGEKRAEMILDYLEDLGQITSRATHGGTVLLYRCLDPEEGRVRDYLIEHGAVQAVELGNALGLLDEEALGYLRALSEGGIAAFRDGRWHYVPPGPERVVTRRNRGITPEQEVVERQGGGQAVPLTGKARGTTNSPMADRKLLQAGHRVRTPSNKGTRVKGRGK